ncbi:AraC family transcriptional regulator [Acuticoccus mangrovi]|uniref:AraC family transcriptional regulator n=1 Tax=Acuticoccus mangrovi TaxID=2796142 RepID=A0A934INJ2_9HYPH|nr:AraC family transcriptional regulator [Acuticoccus mangrovi]MBJ3775658.1 AraC family transcriptional regulator [Acuticoccus mangrovi]
MRTEAAQAGFELAAARFADHQFSPHRHDTYAVGCTLGGVQSFRYRGAGRHALAGDVFVLHPDELHDGRPGTDAGYSYRIAYLSPALILAASDLGRLPFVPAPVSRHPVLVRAIRGVLALGPGEEDDLAHAEALAALADALALMSDAPRRRLSRVDVAKLHRIRDQIADLVPHRVAIGALEREHGIDRFTLARQFRVLFGVSPRRFITLRRLDLVASAIGRGSRLADAALAAGFTDQSHMTRAFRDAFGTSPGEWRRLHL